MLDSVVSLSDFLSECISGLFESSDLPPLVLELIDFSIRLSIIIVISLLVFWITKRLLLHYGIKLISKTKNIYDDYLVDRRVLHRISHLIPALVIFHLATLLLDIYPIGGRIIHTIAVIYVVGVAYFTVNGLLNVLEDIYNTRPYSTSRPIKSYVQLLKIILFCITAILLIAYLFNVKVTGIFTGLGAMAAVLMLIFKDSILGFVASIQLSVNKMVRVGDWISMPGYNADGDVIEITLNTVKVQNWDKTITTIPTYALVSSPFMNWRGMHESGGRRIKRSINIDMRSVRFCTPEMLEKYKLIHHLKDYIVEREAEIERYNKEHNIDSSVKVNGRRMTNLGVFRKYLENYCRRHPLLNQDMTMLIRHLQPTEKGLPIEVYTFSASTKWADYEGVQADIFDHILAVIPEFDLKVFQEPSGADLQDAISGLGSILIKEN
jgi:miniconductance mechanosensitive channel